MAVPVDWKLAKTPRKAELPKSSSSSFSGQDSPDRAPHVGSIRDRLPLTLLDVNLDCCNVMDGSDPPQPEHFSPRGTQQ